MRPLVGAEPLHFFLQVYASERDYVEQAAVLCF